MTAEDVEAALLEAASARTQVRQGHTGAALNRPQYRYIYIYIYIYIKFWRGFVFIFLSIIWCFCDQSDELVESIWVFLAEFAT